MSDLKLPGEKDKKEASSSRVILWIIVGGAGFYFVLSGIVGLVNGG